MNVHQNNNIISFIPKRFRKDFLQVIGFYLLWRVSLVVLMLVAINFVPLGFKDRFLGGGPNNYILSPALFSWANFDGEHYLSIAIYGYKGLEQAFFPIYPKLISIFAQPFSVDVITSLISSTFIGMIISNLSFLVALVLLIDLLKIDYSKKISLWVVVLLLIFPTSFYFGSVYSESTFLLFAVASFYGARKQKWWLAGIFGCLASATRIFGIILLPSLIIEVWLQKVSYKKMLWLLLIPLGLAVYMFYQWLTVGDPLAFYRLQKIVGEQHQSGLTLYPQVMFRYIKMLITVDYKNPIYSTILLEFVAGILFFILPIYGYFKKIRLSYLFFAFFGFLTPTIQGSLSSVPRYVIVFFPAFIAMSIFINNLPKWLKIILVFISLVWLAVETVMFLRGYWVA